MNGLLNDRRRVGQGLLGGLPGLVQDAAQRQQQMRRQYADTVPRGGAPRMMPAPRPIVQSGGGPGDVLAGATDLVRGIGGAIKENRRAESMEGLPELAASDDPAALMEGALQAAELGAPNASRMLAGQYGDVVDRRRAEAERTARTQSNAMLARELFSGDEKAFRTASALASYPDQFDRFVQDRVKPETLANLRQAYDPNQGRLVFATDAEVRAQGLQPPGAKPTSAKPGKSVPLYNPETGAREVFDEGSEGYNSALAAGYETKPIEVTYWSPSGKTVKAVLGKHDPAAYEKAGLSRMPVADEETFRTVTLYPSRGGDPVTLERGSAEHRRLIGSREWAERSPTGDVFDQFLSAAMAGSLAASGPRAAPDSTTAPVVSPAPAPAGSVNSGDLTQENIAATVDAGRRAIQEGRKTRAEVEEMLRGAGIDPGLLGAN